MAALAKPVIKKTTVKSVTRLIAATGTWMNTHWADSYIVIDCGFTSVLRSQCAADVLKSHVSLVWRCTG
jgi:hypothetical protein